MTHRDSSARTIRGEIILPSRRSVPGGGADGEIIDLYPGFDRPITYTRDRPRWRTPKGLLIALWAALAILTLAAGLMALRGPIVDTFPSLSKLYTTIGLPTGAAGLVAENVRVVRVYSRGWIGLSVEGTIANPTGRQVAVPQVTLALRAADGSTLQTLTVFPSRTTLNPGVSAQFTTEIADPPAGMVDIVVHVGDAEPQVVPIN